MSPSTADVPRVTLRGDVEIPQLGFGVFLIGADEAVDAVAHALKAGYRHIDTAAAYRNEEQVGEAIRASGLDRGEVFITTKCFNTNHGYDEATAALGRSLERVGFDDVDLYLIHWPVPSKDRYVETWRALIDAQKDGRTRAIGVSNFQPDHLRRVVDETGVTPSINQVELHPYFQQRELRELHEELGVVTEAWSPLGHGGDILSDEVIERIAEAHGKTTAQVVLRWHLQIGNVVIPKSSTPSRIEENFDIFDFELTAEEMGAIEALDRGPTGRLGPNPDEFVMP